MTKSARRTAALFAMMCESGLALVGAYRVEPINVAQSAWTREGDTVAQVLTCNFDSLSFVELFTSGSGPPGSGYRVDVREGDVELTCAMGVQREPTGWVRFDSWNPPISFTKGKRYEFRFTRQGPDSFRYYYRRGDPYRLGELLVSGESPTSAGSKLAIRVYGRMDRADPFVWGTTCIIPDHWKDPVPRHLWSDSVEASGARWGTIYLRWNQLEPHHDTFDFWDLDAHIKFVAGSAGLEPVGILQWSPKWASTRIDTSPIEAYPGYRVDTSPYAPPRGLWANGDSNLWARYLDSLLDHVDLWEQSHGRGAWHPADSIHTWSIWSECNEGATTWVYGDSYPGYTGAWRRPNREYNVSFNTHDMCSLYVRLCVVAESTIRSHTAQNGRPGHENDRIVIGELARINYESDSLLLVPGREWLRTFYDIADRVTDSQRFWNVVSAHPYQTYSSVFDPAEFESDVETLRTIMREHHDTAQLWNTEFNYGLRDWVSGETNANSLGEAYASILADGGSTSGTYDRACWWLSWASSDNAVWTLLHGDTMAPYPNYYAFRQTASTLTANRFSRRVMSGDTVVDDHTRTYEFEDTTALEKRTWVCWEDGDMKQNIRVKLPVRTDQLAAESLAYSSTTPTFTPRVAGDGWVLLNLSTRPVFIHEAGPAERPDVKVDSVRYEHSSRSVRAWVANHGTAATPVRSGSRVAYPTWAVLRGDGDSLAQVARAASVSVGQQVAFEFRLGQMQVPDTVLLSVTVNPNQTYVELGTDDNIGYTLAVKR